jgi:hypothetical protein
LLQQLLLPKLRNLFSVIGLNLNLARLPPQHDKVPQMTEKPASAMASTHYLYVHSM